MKSCKLLTGIFAAVLAVSFAGCKMDVVSTETSFEDNAHNLSVAENETLEYATSAGDLSVWYNFNQAAADTKVVIEIPSRFKLDEASIDAGVNFYECEKNTVYMGCPVRKNLLTKTKVEYKEIVDTTNKYVTTKITYVVDTSAVTANKIAVLFDATVLKTKQGTAFLNGNGNSIAGESTDSIVSYITILYQAGDVTPKVPAIDVTEFEVLGMKFYTYQEEDFAPLIDFNLSYAVKDIPDSREIVFKEHGDVLDYYTELGKLTDTAMFDVLNKSYIFQTRAWNETTWTDHPLTFAISEDLTDLDKNGVISTVTYPGSGVEWRVVFVSNPAFVNEKIAPYYGGHAAHETYSTTEKKIVCISEVMSDFYLTSPSFIAHFIDYNATAEKTFVQGNISNDDIKNFQNDVLNLCKVPKGTDKYWWLKPRAELQTLDGFIVLDKDGEVIDSEVMSFVDTQDNKTVVQISILDTSIDIATAEPKLYVGSGTTLKENKEYPTELAFGYMHDRSLGKNNGFVEVQKYLRPGKLLAPGFVNLKEWLTDVNGDGSAVYDETNNEVTFTSAGGQAGVVFADVGADFSNIGKIVIKPNGTETWSVSAFIFYEGYDTNGEIKSYVDLFRPISGSEFQYEVSNFTSSLAGLDSKINITKFGIICYEQNTTAVSIGSIELVAKN